MTSYSLKFIEDNPTWVGQGMDLQFQDLDELAKFALDGIRAQRFVIMIGLSDAQATLADRANRIGRGELPIDLASWAAQS